MRKGFTLIEVLVVAVIVAILAAVAIPMYQSYIKDSRKSVAENTAASAASVIGAFVSKYPDEAASIPASCDAEATIEIGSGDHVQKFQMPKGFNMAIDKTSNTITVTSVDDSSIEGKVAYQIK